MAEQHLTDWSDWGERRHPWDTERQFNFEERRSNSSKNKRGSKSLWENDEALSRRRYVKPKQPSRWLR
jgi:hypothetical protein